MKFPGKYFNGQTPLSKKVYCEIIDGKICIYDEETASLVESWDIEKIYQDEAYSTVVVLALEGEKARVEFSDTGILSELDLKKNKNLSFTPRKLILWVSCLIVSVVLLVYYSGFVTDYIAKKLPYEYERKLLGKMDTSLFSGTCQLNENEAVALKSLASQIYPLTEEEKRMEIDIHIIRNHEINAYAFPGGKILVTTEMLKDLKNGEEFLGILAHEMGHIVHRDNSKLLVRSAFLSSLFGMVTGDFSSAFAMSPQIILTTASLSYNRDNEKKADKYAIDRLQQMGISTHGFYDFFKRKEKGLLTDLSFLSTHPNDEERLKLIKKSIKGTLSSKKEDIARDWDILKGACLN